MSWHAQGMRTWMLQRLTAIYMLIYLPVFLFYLACLESLTFQVWRNLFSQPLINIATGFFFFSVLYHAWVGVRDIMIDYVPWAPLRFTLLVLVSTCLLGLGAWAALILAKVVSL